MEEKKAFIGTVFGAMEVADGVKNTAKAYKDNTNKYDDIMGTKLVKTPKKMGIQNAVLSGNNKLASQTLDTLYKEAGFKDGISKITPKIKKVIPKAKQVLDNFDANNTKHLIATKDAFKNKELLRGLGHAGKAVPGTALGAGLIVGSGVGTAKLLKHLDKSNDPKNNIEYNTIGGAISAGMALDALANKRMLAPASKALGLLARNSTKVPGNIVKKTPAGQVFNMAGQGLKATATQANKMNNDINFIGSNLDKLINAGKSFDEAKNLILERQLNNVKAQNWQLSKTDPEKFKALLESRKVELEQVFNTVSDLINKKASERLDDICKVAGIKTDYMRHVVKDRFFKPGLESLPYYAGTAMIGLAVDQNMKKRQRDIELYKAYQEAMKKKEQSNPANTPQEKVASANTVFFKNPKVDAITRQSIESAVEGVGRMAIPLAVSTLIGRDLTNSFRKINRKDDLKDNGMAPDEASIQLSRKDRREMLKQMEGFNSPDKTAEENEESEQNEEQGSVEKKKDESAQNILDMIRGIEKDVVGAKEVLQGDRVHIGNGVKKQFRMNPLHGMHGMTE